MKSKSLGIEEKPSGFVDSPTQNAIAPEFAKEPEVTYAWYGWNEHYPHWSKSCWSGKTIEEAMAAIQSPDAVKMRYYATRLVREIKRFEVVDTSLPPSLSNAGKDGNA